MALPDSVKYVQGTSYIFAFDTDWPASPTQGWSATVDAEIDLGGKTNGTYQQSVKLDLGVNRYPLYFAEISVEFDSDSTAGGTVNVHHGYSHSATAGTGNPIGLTGTDAAYTGYGGGVLANCVNQLPLLGKPFSLIASNDADAAPQVGELGFFVPRKRYMMILVGNLGGATLGSGGTGLADELAIRITGFDIQTQD